MKKYAGRNISDSITRKWPGKYCSTSCWVLGKNKPSRPIPFHLWVASPVVVFHPALYIRGALNINSRPVVPWDWQENDSNPRMPQIVTSAALAQRWETELGGPAVCFPGSSHCFPWILTPSLQKVGTLTSPTCKWALGNDRSQLLIWVHPNQWGFSDLKIVSTLKVRKLSIYVW